MDEVMQDFLDVDMNESADLWGDDFAACSDDEDDKSSLSEDEVDAEEDKPDKYRNKTAYLRSRLSPGALLPAVLQTIQLWATLGLDLPIFLHALSWGGPACRSNCYVRDARTSLMKSTELPVILKNWNKPPHTGNKGPRAPGASDAIEEFFLDWIRKRITQDIKSSSTIFESPVEDVSAKPLSLIRYDKLIDETKSIAPFLWEVLSVVAYSKKQKERNITKRPDLACISTLSGVMSTDLCV